MLLTADEAGEWAFHCHLLYHMMAGMMNKVVVAKLDPSAIPLKNTDSHVGHNMAAPEKQPSKATSTKIDHGGMDHSKMDHSSHKPVNEEGQKHHAH